jgi:hypothetical protein
MKQKLRNTLVSSRIYYISDFITKLPPIGAGDNGGVIARDVLITCEWYTTSYSIL